MPNARAIWKRETPATRAISAKSSSPAKWLSMNHNAFVTGFTALSSIKHPQHNTASIAAHLIAVADRPIVCRISLRKADA